MSGSEVRDDTGERGEEALRTLLVEHAGALTPAPAPYAAIRRRGLAARRRRNTVLGAALAVLTAAPLGMYWLSAPADAPAGVAPASPAPTDGAAGDGQLIVGVTSEQAAQGLRACLDRSLRSGGQQGGGQYASGSRSGSSAPEHDGPPPMPPVEDFRLLLALRATSAGYEEGGSLVVVAVNSPADPKDSTRLQCTVRKGRDDSGFGRMSGAPVGRDGRPVTLEINSSRLFPQGGNGVDVDWKLPFRWGAVGSVTPSVARVTVEYGGVTEEAVLSDGWFAAAGELDREPTRVPHVKGYDAAGELVYDSGRDEPRPWELPGVGTAQDGMRADSSRRETSASGRASAAPTVVSAARSTGR